MAPRPIVLVHGYSASSAAFDEWREVLLGWGYTPELIHVCNYVSLSDEVSIRDLAKGFEGALRAQPGLDAGEEFDAIVHSTGMLVLRSWLADDPERGSRLKHLVGLAPASFGSPLAHKGRTYLGRVIRGNPLEGPDFREAGEQILSALELGSRYTWDLALKDLLGPRKFYGVRERPYVSVFCGTEGYKGIMSVVNEPGTDGTVRMAGAALNTRKIDIDLRASVEIGKLQRYRIADWSNDNIPVVPIEGLNHGSIMSAPTIQLKQLVKSALEVETAKAYGAWLEDAERQAKRAHAPAWQQIVFHVLDDTGQPVRDYFVDFHYKVIGEWKSLGEANESRPSVHPFTDDPSFRCFHLNLGRLPEVAERWAMTVHASSGTDYVTPTGWVESGLVRWAKEVGASAAIYLPGQRHGVEFFHPHTTTLVEITIDRAPTVRVTGQLVSFIDREARVARREAEERERAEEQQRLEALQREGRLEELTEILTKQREDHG